MSLLLLPIISIVLWVSYIIFVLCKFGIPTTISETYYLLSKKWDWIFAVWFFATSTPLCIYWFIIAPHGLKWFPIANWIAMVTIGLCGCYKSGPKDPESVKCISKGDDVQEEKQPVQPIRALIGYSKRLVAKFKPQNLFKYGWKRLVHYVNALGALVLSPVYLWVTAKITVIASLLIYFCSILIGTRVQAVYNWKYSTNHSHNAWVFFAEIICFVQLFIFIIL